MLYDNNQFPKYVRTAGKVTVVTALAGFMVFVAAFVLDFGAKELSKVSAQGSATTTLTVLNTPPQFILNPYEVTESSTSSPTNSGDVQQWSAIAEDSNNAPYFLLICSTNASPTADYLDIGTGLGDGPPRCDAGAVQWGVSASTTSGALATVSTTTEEWGTGQFVEVSQWYAWVCDDDAVNPRCNNIAQQGDYATSSSPFNINNRPVFTANLTNTGAIDPGGTVTWNSTSTDPDTAGGEDDIFLVICNSNTDYNASQNTCPNDFIASTTLTGITSAAAATYTAPLIIRDQTYPAYGYIVDEHGHEASASALQSNFIINNVAPYVLSGEIELNGGSDISLTNANAGETTGFTLDFTIHDANSCLNAASSSEISTDAADHLISVFRSNNSTTTCSGAAGDYDPNDCYVNGVTAATWNISCSATTTCASPTQDYIDFSCTFPLWFIADPSDSGVNVPTSFSDTNWTSGVAGVDDNFATGTMATTSNPVELISAPYIGIEQNNIAYSDLEPGSDTGTLNATSVAQNIGNTGLDQTVDGESMCGTFTPSTLCPTLATSTIPESEQQFSSSSLAYNDSAALVLSSSTPQEVELDINKTTGTSTADYQTGTTYWGIAVPAAITLAGSYTGLNTFYAQTAEVGDW